MTWSKASCIAAVAAVVITCAGGFLKYHNQFAKAEEVKKMQEQVQQVSSDFLYFKLDERASNLQDRMWKLLDEYKNDTENMPQTVKEEYRKLDEERTKIMKRIDKLEKPKDTDENGG